MRHQAIDYIIEALCQRGCRAVRDNLAALERGDAVPETACLGTAETRQVLAELKPLTPFTTTPAGC